MWTRAKKIKIIQQTQNSCDISLYAVLARADKQTKI